LLLNGESIKKEKDRVKEKNGIFIIEKKKNY